MSETEFKQGQQVKAIILASGDRYSVDICCTEIIVAMENGQMAGVPWFDIWIDNEIVSKINGAHVETVVV